MVKHKNNLVLNIATQFIVFFINLLISFFLTPYITQTLGIEAYGFTALASQLINIFSLFILALNSMAGRFITIAIHRNEEEKANKYFSSIVLSNWMFVIIILVPSLVIVFFLESFLSIPANILIDIKILYFILFFNYFIGLVFSTYSISTFVTNKIYLTSLRSLESNLLRILVLFLLYYFLPPFAFYIGITALFSNIYMIFFNVLYKKKFLPKLQFNINFFDIKSIIEVTKSGFWNVLIRLGQLFLDGFDLFISNWFVGSISMGILAISKTIPSTILSLIGFVVFAFLPDFTYLYAQGKIEEFKREVKSSIKILGLIINIPIALLIVYGKDFYYLWLGASSNYETIYQLSVITLLPLVINGSLNGLYGVFTITNKLKINAIAVTLSGLFGLILSIILITFTPLGIFSITISSSIIGFLRNIIITLPFGAIYLGLRWHTFFLDLFKSIFSLCITILVAYIVGSINSVTSWFNFFNNSLITLLIAFIINLFLILSKHERYKIFNSILQYRK
jgi:O-antigen/teichoic acid export membrane protein